MPKLPDIEYAVVSQGPPNTMQAYGAVSDAIGKLGQIGAQAQIAYADGIARSQKADAQLKFDLAMGQDDAILASKAYLSPSAVKDALGGDIPDEVKTVLAAHQDDNAETVPTWQIKPAFYAARAKALTAELAQGIQFPRAREEWAQAASAAAVHRQSQLAMSALREGAEVERASAAVRYELRAKFIDPSDTKKRAELTTDIQGDPWLTPKDKVQLHAQNEERWTLEGKKHLAASLAEGALGVGRDGLTPWVNAGKAQAAFEASVAGKDPLVVEDARQRFTQALAQNNAARQAADAPLLGRLETRLYQGGGLSRLSDDYKGLSPVGQAHIEKLAAAERKLSRSASNEDRRAQADLDAAALTRFRSLDIRDQVAIDPRRDDLGEKLGSSDFAGVSLKGRDAITVEWKKAQDAWKKDQGVSEAAFMREADDLAVRLGLKKKGQRTEKSELFDAYMRTQYRDFLAAQPEDGPKKPSVEQTRAMFRAAIEYGDKGGLHLSGNKFRFQAKPGEEFVPFDPDEQKGHKVLDAGKPATRRVQGSEIGQPGGVWEEQSNGKWKRVE